jgi:superfamily II DNA/RNA helicase
MPRGAIEEIEELVNDGFSPVVFCRFIPTAHYVAEALSCRMPKTAVAAVTGEMAPADRELRVAQLGNAPRRVLVCTDCLSEGINLQQLFDAVVHYDLSWNPTRHEQRDGRVDRFGQKKSTVKSLKLYSRTNRIDGIVLDVLLRKHTTIRNELNVSVPVPVDTNDVIEAILEGLTLREQWGAEPQPWLEGMEEYAKPQRESLHGKWDVVVERKKRSRSIFAQETIKFDEVEHELAETREAIGTKTDVEQFTTSALEALGFMSR